MFNHPDYRADEQVIMSSHGPVTIQRGESRSLNAQKVAGGRAAILAMVRWAADERLWELPDSCALDVADRGSHTCAEVAELLSTDRERVRQITESAVAKMRQAEELEEAAEGWRPEPVPMPTEVKTEEE